MVVLVEEPDVRVAKVVRMLFLGDVLLVLWQVGLSRRLCLQARDSGENGADDVRLGVLTLLGRCNSSFHVAGACWNLRYGGVRIVLSFRLARCEPGVDE